MADYVRTGTAAVKAMQALTTADSLDYAVKAELIDVIGNVLDDITDDVIVAESDGRSAPVVTYTCDDSAPSVLRFRTTREFVWGRDIVRPYMGVIPQQNVSLNGVSFAKGDRVWFPQGAFVLAEPENELEVTSSYEVTGYNKTYLLQSDVGDAFVASNPNTYNNRVLALFTAAGIPNADDGTSHLNTDVVSYPGDWASKVIPANTQTRIWPCDDSNNFAYLDIINDLLKASGCRKLYTDSTGRYAIDEIVKPETQASEWAFDRREGAGPSVDAVLYSGNTRTADVWNLPNQIVYIQSGLTFDPIEGQGQYTINNHPNDSTHYRPGTDQLTIGRVIRSVRRLDASGQSDLVKQAEQDWTETYANAETIALTTAPWPCAGHFDVLDYFDDELPRRPQRKVQAQGWELTLDGSADMTWDLRAVADF